MTDINVLISSDIRAALTGAVTPSGSNVFITPSTVSNGLTATATTVKLGGALTANTNITGIADLNFGRTSSSSSGFTGLSRFQVFATGNSGKVEFVAGPANAGAFPTRYSAFQVNSANGGYGVHLLANNSVSLSGINLIPTEMSVDVGGAIKLTITATTTTIDNTTISFNGNVGIGITAPNTSSLLDLTSTTQGFLSPRMTTVQRNAIGSAATGLIIYNTTSNKLNLYNGSAWEAITSV